MAVKTQDLEGVYGAESPEETRRLYDGWADGYDAENIAKGFRLPGLAAAFVARHVPAGAGPLLDAGCGTGLVGESLAILGYGSLVGLDLSPGMLKTAQATGAYDRVFQHELGTPIPEPDGSFVAATLIGSLGPGHAPPECLADIARVVRPGGHVIFNTRADTAADQGFPALLARLEAEGTLRVIDRSTVHRCYLLTEPELTVEILVGEVM